MPRIKGMRTTKKGTFQGIDTRHIKGKSGLTYRKVSKKRK